EAGRNHYVAKLAGINANSSVVDWRVKGGLDEHESNIDAHPQYMKYGDSSAIWASIPVGSPFPLVCDLPPTDSDAFRYVVLTDDDPYNDGVLINKEVSGTAPNLVIKYTIDMPGSQLHGTKIEMLNTIESVVSPSITNGKVFN
ncbi:hypothetical protein EAY36_28505, partial [Vibrio anguillarum]|nr:hypothetical protein [Vibrio anguillarum]